MCLAPAAARGQEPTAAVAGFGGLSLNSFSPSRPDFGVNLAKDLTPQIQAIGEFGHVSDVLPPLTASIVAFTPLDLRVSAFYGEAGVRMLAGRGRGVSPYVEGTAGFARLNPRLAGLGSRWDPIAAAALNLFETTEPVLGLGGGFLLRSGPVVADLGYRYKQIASSDSLASLLSGGENLRAHQVRFGIGVRF
jgi:hypothetical protein